MLREYKVYLQDILEAIDLIRQFVADQSFDDFMQDAKTRAAVVRELEVIGEAAKAVPEGIRAQAAQIEWRKIAGMRDVLIHWYFGVDYEIVWNVVMEKLSPLEVAVRELLAI